MGVYTAMAVQDSTTNCLFATIDASSERYEIISENIRYTDKLLGGEGLTGTLDSMGNHTRHGTRIVAGSIVMEVGPYDLDKWLPRILGNPAASSTSTTFTTDEVFDLLPFDIMLRRDQGTVQYRACSVSSATFTSTASVGGQGQVMRMTLQIIGHEEQTGTWPTTPPPLPDGERLYWLLGDGKLMMTALADTLPAAAANVPIEYYFDAFSLRIDNNLQPKTRNFLKVVCIQSNGRKIRLRVRTPYTTATHTNLYINFFKGGGVLSFLGGQLPHNNMEVDALYTTVITLPDLRQTRVTPATGGPGEIPLSLDLEAYRVGGASPTEPISIVNTHPA
tara:strand:- start:150 stop:1151 length:1002 start_codon:yes stop_codon:yes gene_type:complete